MKIDINKKLWNTFTDSQMEEYQDKVFQHYRREGFPYFPAEREFRENEVRKLNNFDFKSCINTHDKLIRQTMHGLSFCWSFHPHHYSIPCNGLRTVMDTFTDDNLLRNVIAKRIKMGDNMSDNGLRKMIKIFTGTQCVSNFRPTAAAAIYRNWLPNGGKVWDMSGGFGGRMLGAYQCGDIDYYATEPSTKTFDGLLEIKKYLDYEKCEVVKLGSEVKNTLEDSSIDMCFTSPPYFNCERYSEEPTQSCIKYTSKHDWLNGFLRATIIQCNRVLKSDGVLIINIQNVKSYKNLVEDVCLMAVNLGFTEDDHWKLQLSSLGKSSFKSEPLLVFSKA